MNADDIELARTIYAASAFGSLLFASLFLRGLWRPLRFWLIALVFSFFFTPYFIAETMPDGTQQNIVPAFVVMAYDLILDKEHHLESARRGASPIIAVAAVTSVVAFFLHIFLPKPYRRRAGDKTPAGSAAKTSSHNPYLPDDFEIEAPSVAPVNASTRKNNNPYLPDDFVTR